MVLGEVFTPPYLVQKMLDLVPPETWQDPSKTFLEPSCGNGNFVVAIIQRKIDSGSTLEQALSTTFGVDIDEMNVLECHERVRRLFALGDDISLLAIVLNNIKLGDLLTADSEGIVPFRELDTTQREVLLANAARWISVGHSPDLLAPTVDKYSESSGKDQITGIFATGF